jgi:biotin synthase
MCYAIPGKIKEINDNVVTVDYFGETKKARNEFYKLSPGDYIYAQGGFVIQRIAEKEALDILGPWKELFFKLKEIDKRFAASPKDLYQRANAIRQEHIGNACCIHGIIEFSNYCRNDCLYCGLRKSNAALKRYRMSPDEIIANAEYAINRLNFKALVLQSGEDSAFGEEELGYIIESIMKRSPVLLIVSIGERGVDLYKKLYASGARGALVRFETSNERLYEKYRPGHRLKDRVDLIRGLKDAGYLVFTGFLTGLPGQTENDILDDIGLTGSLGPEMFSFGPFLPHPDTPLSDSPKPDMKLVLDAIATARITYPDSRILATTALETLDPEGGLKAGLLCGANSVMIDVTYPQFRRLYQLYPGRPDSGADVTETINSVIKLLHSIGRAPADLGL